MGNLLDSEEIIKRLLTRIRELENENKQIQEDLETLNHILYGVNFEFKKG